MISKIDGYRDGGTVSVILSYFLKLEYKFKDLGYNSNHPAFVAINGCLLDNRFEICIDKKCHNNNPYIGRWTIGYPDRPYAYEITDLSIKQWIIEQVEAFIKQQQYYLSEMKTLTELYVQ